LTDFFTDPGRSNPVFQWWFDYIKRVAETWPIDRVGLTRRNIILRCCAIVLGSILVVQSKSTIISCKPDSCSTISRIFTWSANLLVCA
jgi:hypothetical protein